MDIVIDLLRRGVFSWQNVEIECNTIILAVISYIYIKLVCFLATC